MADKDTIMRELNFTDPIKIEIFKNIFSSIAEEMGTVLCRTAYSPNIKERRDYSCAIFDNKGDLIAHAAHIPVHLGSTFLSVKYVIDVVHPRKGDVIILNDPYKGGTHLPDITLITPIFIDDYNTSPVAYLANRAHHSDIGGISSGSMPIATEIFQEGLRIPPIRIIEEGVLNQDVISLIFANVRTPFEREGDLEAQIASLRIGESRIKEIIAKYGISEVLLYMEELKKYAEKMTRAAIENLKEGTYYFEDYLDDDGIEEKPVKIAVTVTIKGDTVKIDFSGTSKQVKGCVNAVLAITLSAIHYVIRSIVPVDIPSNSGCMTPITVIAEAGTLVNATFPSAVAGGNVETSQRIVDVLLGAFSQAFPEGLCAASSGSMNNITFGGYDPIRNRLFTYYETIGGGMGARANLDGLSAVHTHMTNTLNTPIEVIENEYPLRVLRYCIRRKSGGLGKFKGGDGICRDFEILSDCNFTILSDRRKIPPYGIKGGKEGLCGENILIRNNVEIKLPSKVSINLLKGDIISIRTPGGGGYGT